MSDEKYLVEDKIALIKNCDDINKIEIDWLPPRYEEDYFFVSYSHKDYKLVFESLHRLQSGKNAIKMWYDEGLPPGKNWEKSARDYISNPNCKGVIFYISENSVLSPSIHKELEFVRQSNKPHLSINLPCETIIGCKGQYLSAERIISLLKEQGTSIESYEEKLSVLKETFGDTIIFLTLNMNIDRQKEKILGLNPKSLSDIDDETIIRLKKDANLGDAFAQNKLGVCYEKGEGVSQDYTKAMFWFEKAANQEFAMAQYNLGRCYDCGIVVLYDPKMAVYWYTKAAEQGDSKAQHNLAICYRDGKGVQRDYKKAVYWFEKAANQGFARAQHNLGVWYKEGIGVQRDYKMAVYWYTEAAEQGLAMAQNNLGFCYQYGIGVTKDYAKAAFWYEKAAQQDEAMSQYNLGICYNLGLGVPQDYEKAFFWYGKAAVQGVAAAEYQYGSCYEHGNGVNIDYELAIHWYKQAADQGHSEAQSRLIELTNDEHAEVN